LLPPVGQRFVTNCPACGLALPPPAADGTRISDRCPDCRALVPLLEPIPAPANDVIQSNASDPQSKIEIQNSKMDEAAQAA
jgi:hypothetical protein